MPSEQADPGHYALAVQFFSDSPAFRDGFEAGTAYARMRDGEREPYTQTVHANSIGQLQHIASRAGWRVEFDRLDETWALMRATPTAPARTGAEDA